MSEIVKGSIAGFIATAVLSVLMLLKAMMGLMPDLNVIKMLADMLGGAMLAGWIVHFVIGALVWGGLFGVLAGKLPGSSFWLKGVIFGIVAWLLMMIMVMPMAGAGLFGLNMGPMAAIMTLMLHIIYGAVLGGVFARLASSSAPRTEGV